MNTLNQAFDLFRLTFFIPGGLLLLLVSYPPKPRIKIDIPLKNFVNIIFPKTCIITGKATTEIRQINFFKITSFGFVIQRLEFNLPFSSEGWERYNNEFPISIKLFKTGINVFATIPFLGILLTLIWSSLMIPVCGVIAITDLLANKRQLIKLQSVFVQPCLLINNKVFADEFYDVNTKKALDMDFYY